MKKTLLIAIILVLINSSVIAQSEISRAISDYRATEGARFAADGPIFQSTIKAGANANQFLVYLKPNVEIPIGSIIAAGAPQVVFSVDGITAGFNVTYAFGGNTLNSSSQIAGGRSRMVIGPLGNTPGITLPWAAEEERLAYTVNVVGDDTIGARVESDLTLGQYVFFVAEETTASDWTNYADPVYPGGPGSTDGVDGIFAYVTLASGILPVTFSKYDIRCNDKGALLTWSTSSEQNSSRFEIQRSVNGSDWVTIDNVTAAGNSSNTRNYQYVDLNSGVAFYRIRQVDLDGRFIYTEIKRTECKGGFDVALYPVPANDKITLVIKSSVAAKTDLQILDVTGRIVKRIPAMVNKGNNNIILDVQSLLPGDYVLLSSEKTITINKKFSIIR